MAGASGQLGREFKNLSPRYGEVYSFADIEELDLTNMDALRAYLKEKPADYIVNCAAYTHVDHAEEEREKAMLLNRNIPANLREVLRDCPGTKLIHISTDYVFEGTLARPLKEEDPVSPLSFYGKSKLEGERMLHDCEDALIIRTSWLYSIFGRNFVKGIINRLDRHEDLRIVYDQVGTPTYAGDLAKAIMKIVSDLASGRSVFVPGIFHYSNEGVCSWYDLGMEIAQHLKSKSRIEAVRSREFPTPARRPAYTVLDKAKIKEVYGVEVPYWRDSLHHCLKKLL
ncbi:MAG: dTDP-4-dehydrorhamnose reductase [Bacteroidetes bacterium]|nr:MAG: dTDP-4-dehydrorhamnose reductase [Bacteroidota bacterium]